MFLYNQVSLLCTCIVCTCSQYSRPRSLKMCLCQHTWLTRLLFVVSFFLCSSSVLLLWQQTKSRKRRAREGSKRLIARHNFYTVQSCKRLWHSKLSKSHWLVLFSISALCCVTVWVCLLVVAREDSREICCVRGYLESGGSQLHQLAKWVHALALSYSACAMQYKNVRII